MFDVSAAGWHSRGGIYRAGRESDDGGEATCRGALPRVRQVRNPRDTKGWGREGRTHGRRRGLHESPRRWTRGGYLSAKGKRAQLFI
jgi:hypothetical protein